MLAVLVSLVVLLAGPVAGRCPFASVVAVRSAQKADGHESALTGSSAHGEAAQGVGGAARRLQQSGSVSCDDTCEAEVGGKKRTYCSCADIVTGNIKVFWDPLQDGTMDMAFMATSDDADEWLAVAFPQEPAVMDGSHAIVAKIDGEANSGAFAEQYYLGPYTSSAVVPENNLDVSDLESSAAADGKLAASFSIKGGGNADLSGDTVAVIVAGGPLGDGQLRKHPWEGSGELVLLAASEMDGGGGEGNAPAPAPPDTASAPSNAAPAPAPTDAASAPSDAAPAPAPTVAAPVPAPTDALSAPAPSDTAPAPDQQSVTAGERSASGNLTSSPACEFMVDTIPVSFERCVDVVQGAEGGLTYFWNTPEPGSQQLSGGLRSSGYGWGAVAFASVAGQMVGASAVIVSEDASQPGGAFVDGYYLAAQSADGVQAPAKFKFLTPPKAAKDGNDLVATFEIDVSPLGVETSSDVPMLYAQGPVSGGAKRRLFQSSGPELEYHEVKGSLSVNHLTQGAGGGTVATTTTTDYTTLRKIHGFFMAISYGVIFPIGIGIARNMKRWDPAWLYIHIAMQLLGYCLGLAGWIIGWVVGGGDSPHSLHRGLGIAVFTLFTLQLSALLYRPKQTSRLRRTWNLAHWWCGRIGLGLAVWNIYLGITDVYPSVTGDSTTGYTIAFSVVLATIVGAFFLLEGGRYAMLPPPGTLQHKPAGIPADAAGRYIGMLPDEAEALPAGNGAVAASSASGGSQAQFKVTNGSLT